MCEIVYFTDSLECGDGGVQQLSSGDNGTGKGAEGIRLLHYLAADNFRCHLHGSVECRVLH